MQKYILGADIGNNCAMIMPIDDKGYTGEWQRYNAGIVYKAEDVDAALAAERQANTELAIRERKAEADLADANHALLLANSNADAFRRVAERHKRAIDWLLRHGAFRRPDGVIEYRAVSADMDVTGAEFADIIKPTTGASNG